MKSHLKAYGIASLQLTGSYAEGNFTKDSDVDLVYTKSDPDHFSFLDRIEVKNEITKLLKKEVDLISLEYIHPFIKKQILSQAIKIF